MNKHQPGAARGALVIIFVIAFLDTLGMTIVMPILPFLTRRYVSSPEAMAIWVGVLTSVFALCAFLSAPALGALSDRIGRKPVLLFSVVGSSVGFVVFGIGGALWVLLLGRIIDGLTAGNMSTIMAYLADITPADDRAGRFGLAGAISGIGFMVGPVAGGLLAHFGLTTPVFVAAVVSFAAAFLGLFLLPESLAPEHRGRRFSLGDVHPLGFITEAFQRPGLRMILLGVLSIGIPMAGLQSNIGVFALDTLRWGPTQIGFLMLGVGATDIVVQGVLAGFLTARLGERRAVVIGLVGQGIAFLALALVAAFTSVWLLVFGGLMIAAGEGVVDPALGGLASRSVSHQEQGWLMGGMSSMGSAARVIGPLLAGALYAAVGRAAPYWFGVAVIMVILVLARSVLFSPLPGRV